MAVIAVGEEHPDRSPTNQGASNNNGHHHARADGLTAAQDERPQLTLLVLGTRLSPLLEGLGPPPARPRPGPGGSRPRRTNSARTTSRPETRISRGSGDPPPTPHHVLGTRRTQLSTRTTPSPDAAGPTGASGDSDTYTKGRRNKDVRAGWPGMTTPLHATVLRWGRHRHPGQDRAHGPGAGSQTATHQTPTVT
jgi:hypothetical protein